MSFRVILQFAHQYIGLLQSRQRHALQTPPPNAPISLSKPSRSISPLPHRLFRRDRCGGVHPLSSSTRHRLPTLRSLSGAIPTQLTAWESAAGDTPATPHAAPRCPALPSRVRAQDKVPSSDVSQQRVLTSEATRDAHFRPAFSVLWVFGVPEWVSF